MKRYYNLDWADGFAICITPCPIKKDGVCIGSLACYSCPAFVSDSFDYEDYMNGNFDIYVECNGHDNTNQ